jgi:hypothetical protein
MTAEEIMKERSLEDYMSWAIKTAGMFSHTPRPRWSFVADMFGTGSGVATALCERFGHDPDEIMGKDWSEPDDGSAWCPICDTEFNYD